MATRRAVSVAAVSIAMLATQSVWLGQRGAAHGGSEAATVKVDWKKVVRVSKTTPTLQVVVNPPLRRGSPIHDKAFQALRELGADYVRYVPWFPYPRLGVAALDPPANGTTSWDFSLIDPMMADFMEATGGRAAVINFSTIPAWMFKTEKPVTYPRDADQVDWTYTQGTELRDPTGRELGDYYARLVSWYVDGGFSDEYGKRHASDHKYKFPFWEVLNEPDLEHQTTAEQYTSRYDAIVAAIRTVAPEMKFVGASLAFPSKAPEFFQYFLDPGHHRAGIPLDMISYHFYAVPMLDQTPEIQQHVFFEQADRFVGTVAYIENIRQRLSPETGTMINEIGSIAADDLQQFEPGYVFKPLPDSYWNLSGAVYAYLFAHLSRMGIDVAGESQLVGFPSQFPSVSMVDWNDGRPNARYWVLHLIKNHFGPGDTLVDTTIELTPNQPYVHAQAFVTRGNERKILLVNKRDRPFEVTLPERKVHIEVVDQTTAAKPPSSSDSTSGSLTLGGYGVAVVTFRQ